MEETSKNNKICQCQYEIDNNLPASKTCWTLCLYHPKTIEFFKRFKAAAQEVKNKKNITNE